MALIFHVRGDSLNARYSSYGKDPAIYRSSGLSDPAVTALVASGVFGSSVIDFSNNTFLKSLAWPARSNWSRANPLSVLIRIVPNWTGVPSASQGLFMVSSDGFLKANQLELWINTAGKLGCFATDRFGATILNFFSTNALSFTAGVPTDIMLSWDGTLAAGQCKISQDGVQIDAITPSAARTADPVASGSITVGNSPNGARSNFKLNELVLYDSAENHVYAVRSGFIASTAFDGLSYTDPGVAKVEIGTGYVFAGVAKTGTYDGSDRWTSPLTTDVATGITWLANGVLMTGSSDEPAPADVKAGVVYDNLTKMGTYTGADRWSAPAVSDTRAGVTFLENGVTRTGTMLTNLIEESFLISGAGTIPAAQLTQGDAVVLQLRAMLAAGSGFDLTNATLETYVVGESGKKTLLAASHTIDADQVANKGKFTIALLAPDTVDLKVGRTEIITKAVQGTSVLHFHGVIDVSSANPVRL